MARPKKKQEVQEDVQTETDDADFFGTLLTPTVSEEDVPAVEMPVTADRSAEIERGMELAVKEINRCNAYIFSGRDLGMGRVFEQSRKEWCDYFVDLEYYRDHPKDEGKLPTPPEIQRCLD